MKRFILSLISVALVTVLFSQAPQSFKYQTVVRSTDGTVIASQTVAFQISILRGSSSGTVSYVETFSVATNQFGLASFNIGEGTLVSGSFTTIDWSTGLYFVKVEIDPLNGSAFEEVGTSQLLSVPYSLYSETSSKAKDLDLKLNNLTNSMVAAGMVSDADGNLYTSVSIGDQVWLTQNLRTTRYSNGDLIGTTSPATKDISAEGTPKYQWAFNGNEDFVPVYGRLYTWYAATDSRNVCPTGWHLPSAAEMDILATYAGGNSVAGGKIKESGTDHWTSPNPATNDYGFTALPGGNRPADGVFGSMGTVGQLWNSDPSSNRGLLNTATDWYSGTASSKIGFSVRCLKDAPGGTNPGGIPLNTPINDLTGTGVTSYGTVDANSTGVGAALYIASDGNYEEADADAVTTMPCVALALETGTGNKKILLQGYIRNNSWTWTPGGQIFISPTTGLLTQTSPSVAGQQVQIVGYAIKSNTVFFNPNFMLIELK